MALQARPRTARKRRVPASQRRAAQAAVVAAAKKSARVPPPSPSDYEALLQFVRVLGQALLPRTTAPAAASQHAPADTPPAAAAAPVAPQSPLNTPLVSAVAPVVSAESTPSAPAGTTAAAASSTPNLSQPLPVSHTMYACSQCLLLLLSRVPLASTSTTSCCLSTCVVNCSCVRRNSTLWCLCAPFIVTYSTVV
jgi:hypothetical protein